VIRRGRTTRFALLFGLALQLCLPGAAAVADARFDGVLRPLHFESHTTQACAPLHPPDCALCRFITTPAQAGSVTIVQAGQPESRWPTPTTHNTQRSAWFTRQALPRAPPTLS